MRKSSSGRWLCITWVLVTAHRRFRRFPRRFRHSRRCRFRGRSRCPSRGKSLESRLKAEPRRGPSGDDCATVSFKNVQTLVMTGSPVDQFDIVILGDGFQEHELGTYDARAVMIAGGLLSMPPLAAHSPAASISIACAPCRIDSGITNCPSVGETRSSERSSTCRGTSTANMRALSARTRPSWFADAAELIAPREHLELFLVIANCSHQRRQRVPDQDLAFVTM